jgi:Malate/L-lactate dehydrogenases
MLEEKMELSLEDAHALVVKVMKNFEQNEEYANIIADHIIDCELRGLSYGGLARILSITERLQRTGNPTNFVEVVHETPTSARLRGHDNLGYVVGYKATDLAISKAKESGIAIVGANETWYTGMLSYFAEMVAAEGMVSIIASNCTAWVAPHNAVDGRFGNQPYLFWIPNSGPAHHLGYWNFVHKACRR